MDSTGILEVRGRSRRSISAILLAGVISFVLARSTFACTCFAPPLAEEIASAEAIFAGTVTSFEQGGGPVWLTVDTVWKGDIAIQTVVNNQGYEMGCGYGSFRIGERVLIFADGPPEYSQWEVDGCSNTSPWGGDATWHGVASWAETMKSLGPGRDPRSVAGTGWAEPGPLLALALLCLTSVVILERGRRRALGMKRRALAAIGGFGSTSGDLARDHDRHFAESIES